MDDRYVIEKLSPSDADPADPKSWLPAWGLKARSYPRVPTDEQAIEVFRAETAKVRTPHRLIRWASWGMTAEKTVLASNTDEWHVLGEDGEAFITAPTISAAAVRNGISKQKQAERDAAELNESEGVTSYRAAAVNPCEDEKLTKLRAAIQVGLDAVTAGRFSNKTVGEIADEVRRDAQDVALPVQQQGDDVGQHQKGDDQP